MASKNHPSFVEIWREELWCVGSPRHGPGGPARPRGGGLGPGEYPAPLAPVLPLARLCFPCVMASRSHQEFWDVNGPAGPARPRQGGLAPGDVPPPGSPLHPILCVGPLETPRGAQGPARPPGRAALPHLRPSPPLGVMAPRSHFSIREFNIERLKRLYINKV